MIARHKFLSKLCSVAMALCAMHATSSSAASYPDKPVTLLVPYSAGDSNINIIMLSARTDEVDRIRGYECGADFYLCKPVSPAELSAAVKAVKRRVQADTAKDVDLSLNVLGMRLTSAEGSVHLSRSDFALIKALAIATDHRLPYWRLFEVTERSANEQAKSQLELQVFRLRKKLAKIGIPENFIKSMRSEGYQLTHAIRIDP